MSPAPLKLLTLLKARWLRWSLAIVAVLAAAVCVEWRVLRGLSLIAASGSLAGRQLFKPCSGYIERDDSPPPVARDKLVDVTITPDCVMTAGQTLHVTARTNCSALSGVPYACYGLEGSYQYVGLHDDGTAGDGAPLDGNWAADLPWSPAWNGSEFIQVYILLALRGEYSQPDSIARDMYIVQPASTTPTSSQLSSTVTP